MNQHIIKTPTLVDRICLELTQCANVLKDINPSTRDLTPEDIQSLQSIDRIEQTLRALSSTLNAIKDTLPADLEFTMPEITLEALSARLQGNPHFSHENDGEIEFF